MASKRELELIIKAIDQSATVLAKLQTNLAAIQKQVQGLNSQTIKVEAQGTEKAAKGLGQAADQAKRLGQEAEGAEKKGGKSFLLLAAAVGGITQAFQLAIGISQRFYNETIGANERLQQQILASAATISATNRVIANGVEITDPTERIKALRAPIKEGIEELEIATRDLVGVTSQQVNEVFSILLTNSGQLVNQSEQFKDSISASVELSRGFTATLGTLGIDLSMARQEVNSILQGQITSDSILAKSLGITNEQVRNWRAQGKLVDELNKKLEPFVAGNALAANSISGVSSNILDIIQVLARQASEPLLQPIIDSLNQVYQFANDNQDVFIKLGQDVSGAILAIADVITRVLEPLKSFASEGTTLKTVFDGVVRGVVEVVKALEPLAAGLIILIKANIEATIAGLKALAPVLKPIAEFALNALRVLGDGFENAANVIANRISPNLGELKTRLDEIFKTVQPFIGIAQTILTPTIQAIKNAATTLTLLPPILEKLKEGFKNAFNVTPLGIFLKLYNEIGKAIRTLSAAIPDLWSGYSNFVDQVNNIIKPVADRLAALISRGEALVKNARAILGVKIEVEDNALPTEKIKALGDTTAAAIKQVAGTVDSEFGNIDIGRKIAEDLGTIPDQLKERLAQAQDQLNQGIGGAEAAQQVKTVLETTGQLLDQGVISREEAAKALQQVAGNEKLLLEDRVSAATQLRKLQADSSNSRLTQIKNEIAAVEAANAFEGESTESSIKKLSDLRQQDLQARIDATANAIKAEEQLIASGSGSQKELDRLKEEQKSFAAEQVRLTAQTQQELEQLRQTQLQKRLDDINTEIAAVEAQQAAEGEVTAESVQKIADLRKKALDERLRANREAIAEEQRQLAAGTGSKSQLEALQREQKQLAAEGVKLAAETEQQIRQARLAEIEKTAAELTRVQLEAQANVFRQEQALKERRATDATFTEEQLQAELAAIQLQAEQDKLAQDIQLQQQRVAVYKEGTKERIDAENQLYQLQLEQEKQVEQARENARQAAVAEINARIEGVQQLQEFEQKRLELLRRAEDLIIQSLDRQKSLFDSQVALAQSAQDIQVQTAQIEAKRLREALGIRKEISQIEKELQNKEIDPEQRKLLQERKKTAEKELEILGLRNKSERQIEKELFDKEKERIQRERQQVEFKQAVERANLEFEIQRDVLAAKRALREEEARKRELEFQKTLLQLEVDKARARGDERAAQTAERGIGQLDQSLAQQDRAIAEANQGVRDTEALGQQRREALAVQQAGEDIAANAKAADDSLQLFRDAGEATKNIAADFAKESQKVLQQSLDAGQELAERSFANVDKLTETLYANLNRAVKTIEDVFKGSGGSPESRDVGGPVNAGQLYQFHAGEIVVPGASSKPQAMKIAGRGMFLDSNQLFRPSQSGYVLNRGDVSLLGLSAGLVPQQNNPVLASEAGFSDSRLLGAMGQGNVFLRQLVDMAKGQNQATRKAQANERLRRFTNGR